jgi:hypothetical protein
MKLEVVVELLSDVDRAKSFYARLLPRMERATRMAARAIAAVEENPHGVWHRRMRVSPS